jgi:hypothetical protein
MRTWAPVQSGNVCGIDGGQPPTAGDIPTNAPGLRSFGSELQTCMQPRLAVNGCLPRLVDVLAKASPLRSGDHLAGVAAGSATERVAAQMALADIPLRQFLNEAVIPYEADEVTRLILDSHDAEAFRRRLRIFQAAATAVRHVAQSRT